MNYSVLTLYYGASFGKCDGSDQFEWEIRLTKEQENLFKMAVMKRESVESIPGFNALIEEAYDEIKDLETENMLDDEDEYTMECMGVNPMDSEYLNELVHSKDPYAIKYFGLEDLSDEEIEDWDADIDLDEIPLVKEFEEDFEPSSPFDEGWGLFVSPQDVCDIDLSNEEIETYISEALDNKDFELAYDVVVAQSNYYSGDIWDKVISLVKDKDCYDLYKAAVIDRDIEILGEGYQTGYFEYLFQILDIDCIWESQWVLEPRKGIDTIKEYYREKARLIRKSQSYPKCFKIRLVDNINMVKNANVHINGGEEQIANIGYFYEKGKICLLAEQTCDGSTNRIVMEIKLNDKLQISRIDLANPLFYKYEIVDKIKEEEE